MGYAEGDGTVVWCGGACYQQASAHIFEEGELNKDVVVAKYATTTQHGAIEGKTQTNETVTICNQLDYYCVNYAV